MIECNNAECNIGWYHKRCVKLRDDYTAEFWLCTRCQIYEEGDAEYYFNSNLKVKYDKEALASSNRVHFSRSVHHVWDKHTLPPELEIVNAFMAVSTKFEERYCRLEEKGGEEEEGGEGGKDEYITFPPPSSPPPTL